MNVPVYNNIQFRELKTIYNSIWPEQWDTVDTPQHPYNIASKYIVPGLSRVLDIACGYGAGTENLSDKGAAEVVGVDVSQKAINHCLIKYKDYKNLTFQQGDALSINLNSDYFDIVISIHTMEHITDDNLFLKRIWKWLKKKGIIIVEVPLLMRRPFLNSNEPLNGAHIRECSTIDLIKLFSKYFEIKETYGVSRGYYVDLYKTRNAVLLVGEKENWPIL